VINKKKIIGLSILILIVIGLGFAMFSNKTIVITLGKERVVNEAPSIDAIKFEVSRIVGPREININIVDSRGNELGGQVKIKEESVELIPTKTPIKKIEFNSLETPEEIADLGIDDVPETGENAQFLEVYAIDPTAINFTNATVTVTATGNVLYKCKNWNFTEQTCIDKNWTLFKTGLVPGQEYNFTLTPDDPGFGEGITSTPVDIWVDQPSYEVAGGGTYIGGKNFTANGTVQIDVQDITNVSIAGYPKNITADSEGGITHIWLIPIDQTVGNYTISAVDQNNSSLSDSVTIKLISLYNKIKDDAQFNVTVVSTNKNANNTLTVIFYHNSNQSQTITITGPISYNLSTISSVANENVTLTVYNWTGKYFRLVVGKEVLGFEEGIRFGKQKTKGLNAAIKNAAGTELNATIEFIDALTDVVEYNVTGKIHSGNIKEGRYKVRIKPVGYIIKQIEFSDLDVSANISNIINIDDVPENISTPINNLSEVYAIDASASNFSSAIVTVQAKGKDLFKCTEWTFTTQICTGRWKKIANIIPGQEYNFTIRPGDPGMGEGRNKINLLDKESYLLDYNETVLDNINNISNVELVLKNSKAKKIIANELNESSADNDLIIDEQINLTANQNETRLQDEFLVNTLNFSSENVTITLDAIGRDLFECQNWTANQTCLNKTWTKVQDIEPNSTYNFTITEKGRKGFAESKRNVVLLDKELKLLRYNEQVLNATGPIRDLQIEMINLNPRWIKIYKHNTSKNKNDLKVQPLNASSFGFNYIESYSLDPTGIDQEYAEVSTTAVGNTLFKCTKWNFTTQTCEGRWKRIKNLVPGQEYNFTLTADDPGYSEGNNSINLLDTEDYLINSNHTILSNESENYNILIKPLEEINDSIVDIEVHGYNESEGKRDLKIDKINLTASQNETRLQNTFSFDTANLSFSNNSIIVKAKAKGRDLFRCNNWTDNNTCADEKWTKIKDIEPNATYNFTITQKGKKGFAESKREVVLLDKDLSLLKYNEEVLNATGPIKDLQIELVNLNPRWIKIHKHNTSKNKNDLKVQPLNASTFGFDYIESYSIDPTGIDQEYAEISTTAIGKTLFKCAEFNFTTQECMGRWKKIQNIIPGQNYTFNFTATDPGYSEGNNTINILDKNDYLIEYNETILTETNNITDIEIIPKNHKIKKIIIKGHNKTTGKYELKIENSTNEMGYLNSFSVNPLDLDFNNATITLTAVGTDLYKCSNWNFTIQTCIDENWTLFKTGLVPGQEYNFTLTPEDPGFGEINATNATHLDTDYSVISDIYDYVKTKDNNWSEPIYENQFVRVKFEQNLSNGSWVDLYVRDANATGSYLTIYPEGNTNVTFGSANVYSNCGNTPCWQYIELANISTPTDVFDMKILNDNINIVGFLEFDYIHDGPPAMVDDIQILPSSNSQLSAAPEKFWVNITYSQEISNDYNCLIGLRSAEDTETGTNQANNGYNIGNTTNEDGFRVIAINTSNCSAYGCSDNGNGQVHWVGSGVFTNATASYLVEANKLGSFDIDDKWTSCIIGLTGKINLFVENITIKDITDPTVKGIVPSAGTDYNLTNSVLITANVTDNINVSTVKANITWPAGNELLVMTDNDNNDIYNATFTTTNKIGQYNVTIIANDTTGNINNTETTFFYVNDVIKPSITLTFPNNNFNTTSTTINFNWTAVDNYDSILTCNLTIDGIVNASNIASSNNTPTNYSVSGFGDRTYYWNATCWDNNNNINTSETRSFNIDATLPSWSNITETPADPAYYFPEQDYEFNISWDDDAGIDNVLINWNGINYTDEINNISNIYTFNRVNLTVGVYNYTWFANDTNGNINNIPQNYTILALSDYELNGTVVDEEGNPENVSFEIYNSAGHLIYSSNNTLDFSFNGTQEYDLEIASNYDPYLNKFSIKGLFNNTNITDPIKVGYNGSLCVVDPSALNYEELILEKKPVNTSNNIFIKCDGYYNLTTNTCYGSWIPIHAITSPDFANYSFVWGDPAINEIYIPTNLTSAVHSGANILAQIIAKDNVTYLADMKDETKKLYLNFSLNLINGTILKVFATQNKGVAVGIYDQADVNGTNPLGTLIVTSETGGWYNTTLNIAAPTNAIWLGEGAGSGTDPKEEFDYIYAEFPDTTKPSIVLNYPENNFNTSNTTINFNWTAADNLDTQPLCNLTIDGIVNASSIITQNNTAENYSVSGLDERAHNWSVTCWDDTLNTNTSETRSFTVDSTKPSTTIISPQSIIYNNAEILVNISVSDEHLDSIWFFNGTANETYTVPVYRTFSEGSNILYVYANDTFGNLNTTNVSFTIDTTNPAVTNLTAAPTVINQTQTANITAIITDDVDIDKVILNITKADGITTSYDMIAGANDFYYHEYTPSGSDKAGTYSAKIIANDTVNHINDTEIINFTVLDITKPSVTIIEPTENSTNDVYSTVEIKVNATDETQVDIVYANITWNSVYEIINLSYNATSSYYEGAFTNTSLPATYNLAVIAIDTAGNTNNTEKTYFNLQDVGAPTYSNIIESPSEPITYSIGQNYQFNITWIDNVNVDSVILEFDGTNYTDIVPDGNVYSRTFVDLSAGTHNYIWYANDTSNNQNNTGVLNYTIDKTSSSINLTLDGIAENKTIEINTAVTIKAETITPSAGYLKLYQNGDLINNGTDPLVNTTTYPETGAYNITAIYLTTQNYLESSETLFITVEDTQNPSVTNIITNPGVINQTQLTNISVIVTDDANITVKLNITKPDNITTTYNMVECSGDLWYYEYTPSSQDKAGKYNITIIAEDTSENINDTETDFFDVNDVTPPIIIIVSPTENATYNYNGLVAINVNATDETQLGSVSANITWNTNNELLALNYNPSSGLYENSFTDTTYLGRYNASIIANDSVNNINTETTYFNIADLSAPTYSNIRTDPESPAIVNETLFTFYAAWNDNVNISKIILEFNSQNYTVTTKSGDEYYYSFVNLSAGKYDYKWYSNDTSGNSNNTDYFNYTILAETIPPNITSYSVYPAGVVTGQNVTIDMNAIDNSNISATWAQITLPNSSIETITTFPSDYTTEINGRHNITFFANDTSGNTANETDYFMTNTGENITINVGDYNSTGVETNLTIYLSGTNKEVDLEIFDGTLAKDYAQLYYDLLFIAYNKSVKAKLNNVNLAGNKTLGLDKKSIPVTGYLTTYGITSELNQSNVTLTIDYTNAGFTNEDYLGLYKCAEWNFTAQTCTDGNWTFLSGSTQDKRADTFTVILTTLSGFSIKQESYCGDGTCDSGEDYNNCATDCTAPTAPSGGGGGGCSIRWNCTDWSECAENETQTRFCIDIGTCNRGNKTETQSCTYIAAEELPPITEVPKPAVKIKDYTLLILTGLYRTIRDYILWVLVTIAIISGSVAVVIQVQKHKEEIAETGQKVFGEGEKRIEKLAEKTNEEMTEIKDLRLGIAKEKELEEKGKEFIVSLEAIKKKDEVKIAALEKDILALEKDIAILGRRKQETESISRSISELKTRELQLENKENRLSNLIKKDKELSKDAKTKIEMTEGLIKDYKSHIKKLEELKQEKDISASIIRERLDLLQTASDKLSNQKSAVNSVRKELEEDESKFQIKKQDLAKLLKELYKRKQAKFSGFKKAKVAVPAALKSKIDPALKELENKLKNLDLNIKLIENKIRKLENKERVLALREHSKIKLLDKEREELKSAQNERNELDKKISASTFGIVENTKLLKELEYAQASIQKDLIKRKQDIKRIKIKEDLIKKGQIGLPKENGIKGKEEEFSFKEKINHALLDKKKRRLEEFRKSVKDLSKVKAETIKKFKERIGKIEEDEERKKELREDIKERRGLIQKIKEREEKLSKKEAKKFTKDIIKEVEKLDEKTKKQVKKTKEYKKQMLEKLRGVYR